MKATLKELSFHLGGFKLHNLFWENLAPVGKGGGGMPKGSLAEALNVEFGKFDPVQKGIYPGGTGVEGSGWAALTLCRKTGRPLIMQIEKHNANVFPGFSIIMVLDVWEHAYYLDYKNDRAKFVDAFWNIVNWDEIDKRFDQIRK